MRTALDIARERLTTPRETYWRVLGAYIAGERESRKILQKEMAQRLHMSQSAYSRMEAGDSGCDVEELERIAEVLQMTVADILDGARRLRSTL